MSLDSQNRLNEATTAESNLNNSTNSKAGSLRTIINSLNGVVTSTPAPANIIMTMLTKAIYEALRLPIDPLDVDRALRNIPGTQREDIDPLKAFALMLAIAIIKAIWCFIKTLLNPLPVVGRSFPLCSSQEINNPALNISVPTPAQITTITFPEAPVPTRPPVGKSYSEYLSQRSRSTPVTATAPGSGGVNRPNIPQASTPITHEDTNISQEQLRRMFGL